MTSQNDTTPSRRSARLLVRRLITQRGLSPALFTVGLDPLLDGIVRADEVLDYLDVPLAP